jgi:uncharacterized protein (TIRG00374 family)
MTRTQRNWLFTGVKVLISTGLMVFLYRKIDVQELGKLLASANLWYLLPIAVLLFFNTVFSALKWRLFLLADQVDISLAALTKTYLIGSFYNLFLPSNIGGDSYRIYDIARQSGGVRSAASVFADRFSGFLALVILSLLSSVLVARQFHNIFFFLAPLFILLLLLAILVSLAKEKPIRLFLRITRLNRFPLLTGLAEKFFCSFQAYGKPKLLVQVMAISFAFQLSVITIVWLLAGVIHAQVSFFYFSAFVPLITLLEALPISIFGLGLRDAGYVFFFGWAGMNNVETRSLALLFLGTTVSYSLLGGLVYLSRLFSSVAESPQE